MARSQSDTQIATALEMRLATARTYATRVLWRLGIGGHQGLMQRANVLDPGTR
jgi:DNA-binding NarL/FixJ family response regulator